MRKLAMIAMSLLVLIGAFRLTTMSSVTALGERATGMTAQEMPDCPMGFVCPAQFESVQLIGSISTLSSLGLLLAFVALAFALVLIAGTAFRTHLAPLPVLTDTGPPALRSVFKRE